jgi:[NiFe] hydrogenase assembly HybE family chaperone
MSGAGEAAGSLLTDEAVRTAPPPQLSPALQGRKLPPPPLAGEGWGGGVGAEPETRSNNVALQGTVEEPPTRLEQLFTHIHATRMHDVPIVNPLLRVECVGFRRWQGRWLGVLVTPWCMNLVLMRDEPQAWQPARTGEVKSYTFPTGHFEFIGTVEPDFGDFQMCSLFSPVFEFREQDVARATALAALDALFDPATTGRAPPAEADEAVAEPPVPAAEAPESPSKRNFLRGRFGSEPR